MEQGSGMSITGKAFKHGGRILPQYMQEGQGAKSYISPPLEWYNVPDEAKCLALIMVDPEPQMENSPTSVTHLIVFNVAPAVRGLPEGVTTKDHDMITTMTSPVFERAGTNSRFPVTVGPNPPVGNHTYEFHLCALDDFPKSRRGPTKTGFWSLWRGIFWGGGVCGSLQQGTSMALIT